MTKIELYNILYAKYESSLLSREQVAKELNKSVATIDRWKKAGLHLKYKKNGKAKNSTVEYPIDAVVDYVLNNNIKVI
jgi:transposase